MIFIITTNAIIIVILILSLYFRGGFCLFAWFLWIAALLDSLFCS